MKNCDEMVNSLLERKSVYEAEQKRKRKTVTSLCCVCFVAMLGIAANKSGMFESTPPVQQTDIFKETDVNKVTNEAKGENIDSAENTDNINAEPKSEVTYPNENYTVNANKTENTDVNRINIQPITGALPANRMDICLLGDDFIRMSRQEMIEYYGVDYIPEVPNDIKPWDDEISGIYRRNGGTGEVYWDQDILNFSNEDFSREVHVEVAKGHLPFLDYLHFDGSEEKSVINNVEVFIGLTDSGYYYTEFMYKDTGFLIHANGLTEEEFVAIIASIIE